MRTHYRVTLTLAAIAAAALVVALLKARSGIALDSMHRRNTLLNIAVALKNYDQHFESLPPAITNDRDGQSLHSWRPLILPHMIAMRPVYDLQDRWDGPKNSRLLRDHVFDFPQIASTKAAAYQGTIELAPYFRCFQSARYAPFAVDIVAITGEQTLWPSNSAVSLDDIPDGASNTVMLAESCNLNPLWSEPLDLQFDEMSFEINDSNKPSISSEHRDGPVVLMADMSVYRLSPALPPEILRALVTCDGGEAYNARDLVEAGLLLVD